MKRRRADMTVPIIAMVDAFVGGISILLVLTILSSPSSDLSGTIPVPDAVVTCGDDGKAMFIETEREETERLETNRESLAEQLARLATPGRLHMNVLVRTSESERACYNVVRYELRATNKSTDHATLDFQAPVYLVDAQYHETAAAE